MVRDPTDERYRKPRRLGGTEYQKYFRRFALGVTALYGLAIYAYCKKHMPQLSNEEIEKIRQEFHGFPLHDHGPIIPLDEIWNKLTNIWKKEDVSEGIEENKQE